MESNDGRNLIEFNDDENVFDDRNNFLISRDHWKKFKMNFFLILDV